MCSHPCCLIFSPFLFKSKLQPQAFLAQLLRPPVILFLEIPVLRPKRISSDEKYDYHLLFPSRKIFSFCPPHQHTRFSLPTKHNSDYFCHLWEATSGHWGVYIWKQRSRKPGLEGPWPGFDLPWCPTSLEIPVWSRMSATGNWLWSTPPQPTRVNSAAGGSCATATFADETRPEQAPPTSSSQV